jgi:hypothetical protein
MTEHEMKKALGILLDDLAKAAFQGYAVDSDDAQEALQKAGPIIKRPATEADCKDAYSIEPGDDYYALTPFAVECRQLAVMP